MVLSIRVWEIRSALTAMSGAQAQYSILVLAALNKASPSSNLIYEIALAWLFDKRRNQQKLVRSPDKVLSYNLFWWHLFKALAMH